MSGWTNNEPTSLTVPTDALPGDPRTVIGPEIPAELSAFYTANGYTVRSAVLYYVDGVNYWFTATVTRNNPGPLVDILATGSSRSGVVQELYRHSFSGPTIRKMEFGTIAGPNPLLSPNLEFNSGQLEIAAGATFQLTGPATIDGTYRNANVSAVSRSAAFATTGQIPFTTIDRNGPGVPFSPGFPQAPSTAPITISTAGLYLITARTVWISGPLNGVRALALLVNGGFAEELKITGVAVAQDQPHAFAAHRELNAGDTLGLNAFISGITGTNNGVKLSYLSAKLESI